MAQKKIPIMIFQAPHASLMERGLYLPMRDLDHPFCGVVPAEYYMPTFNGEIECPLPLPENCEQRTHTVLEWVYTIFNTAHPVGYCGRSLSVGDVVKLEGNFYLCAAVGFKQVEFRSSSDHPTPNPTVCPTVLPDGTALRVTICKGTLYPGINIDMIAADGTEKRVCFVEHNPEKEPGQELCIGVYCDAEEDTVYYDSYFRECNNNIGE